MSTNGPLLDTSALSANTAPTVFEFTALRADGLMERGRILARNQTEARSTVVDRGMYVVSLAPTASKFSVYSIHQIFRRQPTLPDLAVSFKSLSTLLNAGLPVKRALNTLREIAPPRVREYLPEVAERVTEGDTLSDAFDKSGWKLPPILIGLIRAGEGAGRLSSAVQRAAQFAEREAAARSALVSALAYPLLLLVVGGISCLVLIGIVIPRFAELFADLDRTLPASTQFILSASKYARDFGLSAFLVTATSILVFFSWIRQAPGRLAWHSFLLRVPVVATVRRSSATGRICTALSDLLDSGVPIATALSHAAKASGDAAIEAQMLNAKTKVVGGQALSDALRSSGALSPVVLGLVRTGEESASLVPMLVHAGRLETERVEQLLKSSSRMIEPVMILLFGGIVAFVAAAILQAVYGIRVST